MNERSHFNWQWKIDQQRKRDKKGMSGGGKKPIACHKQGQFPCKLRSKKFDLLKRKLKVRTMKSMIAIVMNNFPLNHNNINSAHKM
jgi:hypothetical protein